MFRQLSVLIVPFLLLGCKEEKTVVYSERIAVLPDRSGYLTKELRSWEKTKIEMVLSEVKKTGTRELFVIALNGFDDVKFKSLTKGDTVHLYHTESGLEKNTSLVAGAPTFPVRFRFVTGADWLSAGVLEGDPAFYAEEKWGKLLELMAQD
jgi:hypothetical protein